MKNKIDRLTDGRVKNIIPSATRCVRYTYADIHATYICQYRVEVCYHTTIFGVMKYTILIQPSLVINTIKLVCQNCDRE